MPTAWRERLAAVLELPTRLWRAHPQTKRTCETPLLQSSGNGPGKPAGGSQRSFACPHCGLMLTILPDKLGTHLSFDFGEWKRRCRSPGLESPVLCLVGR